MEIESIEQCKLKMGMKEHAYSYDGLKKRISLDTVKRENQFSTFFLELGILVING